MCATAMLAVLALGTCAPPARAIVAEVYYDAPGDDTGWEFVELFNPGDATVALAGVRLEAGDGAGPGRWSLRWTGGTADSVRARGRFVIGGAHVTPPPDAVTTLDLQNGPDAVRIAWPDGTREVVGWGALGFAEYSCGAPAADAPAGQSLARVPDDADLGGNALDFRPAEPSPGRANQPALDLALARGGLVIAPERPEPDEATRVMLRVTNRGRDAVAGGAASLALAGDALAAPATTSLPALAPGETLRVSLPAVAGAAGKRSLVATVSLPGDAEAGNDADTLRVRVGQGPLEITEIQFHPAFAEGEWVEVRNRSGEPLALADFTLSDRAEGHVRIVTGLLLPADSLALLAQGRDALLAVLPALDSTRIVGIQDWPTLNNTNDSAGVADAVSLRESDGTLVDRVAYSAAGVSAGNTLEKVDGAWRAAPAPGSPLAPPGAGRSGELAFDVTPRRLPPGESGLGLAWRLPWASARVTVELYDLAGRRAALLLDDVASTGAEERRVSLEPGARGVYVAVLRARGPHATLTRSALLRVDGAPR